MSYENVYNSPEKHGLKIIFSNDIAGSYEFNTVVVFKALNEEKYYFAHDSGCSCPRPFENFDSVSDLTPIETSNMEHFEQSVKRHLEPSQIQDIRRAVFQAHFRPKVKTKTMLAEELKSMTAERDSFRAELESFKALALKKTNELNKVKEAAYRFMREIGM